MDNLILINEDIRLHVFTICYIGAVGADQWKDWAKPVF